VQEKPLTTRWHVGDRVTPRTTVAKRSRTSVSHLGLGTPATVAAIIPPVTGNRRYLLVVDYLDGDTTRRTSLHADNVRRLDRPSA